MLLAIRTHESARHFLGRAERWLLQSEAEHSLMLGIASRLAEGPGVPDEPPYLATVEHDGAVVGAALRTPPYKLLLTKMPLGALPLLAESVVHALHIPAVLGPVTVAQAFGREWARRRSVTARPGPSQRIFELTHLVPPARAADGQPRRAGPGDLDQVTAWIGAFQDEVGVMPSDPREWAARHLSDGLVLLWEDGGPVAMAAEMARSPMGARVGAVYAPPERRGRGYATAVVFCLSRQLLAEGLRFCSLYTDLANPTSNAIYQRLGYRPIADVMDVEFGSVES